MFNFRHVNRLTYPQKHILICEDDITNQKNIINHFFEVFDPQGLVQISIVPGGLAAAGIISHCKIDVIILDHDMPEGNGQDLLNWLKSINSTIPVITFSGIPYNNANMISWGATHFFGKNEVVIGQADDLIKSILGLQITNEQPQIAEQYTNIISPNSPVIPRYWITPNILIGGDILDQADWEHLQKDFGIKSVINVDGRSDSDKTIENLLEIPVLDDGTPFPKEYIIRAANFALENKGPIYIHCHMGYSRSPHFAYAIIRQNYKLSKEYALAKVKSCLPSDNHNWGFNQHTNSYIKSIEDAIGEV